MNNLPEALIEENILEAEKVQTKTFLKTEIPEEEIEINENDAFEESNEIAFEDENRIEPKKTKTRSKKFVGDYIDKGGSREKILFGIACNTLGRNTLLTSVTMEEFVDLGVVPNVESKPGADDISQRPPTEKHAKGLATYLMKALIANAKKINLASDEKIDHLLEVEKIVGTQEYFSLAPIVCSIDTINADMTNLEGGPVYHAPTGEIAAFRIKLKRSARLKISDGQHRLLAMRYLLDFCKTSLRTKTNSKNSLIPSIKGRLSEDILLTLEEVLLIAQTICTVQLEVHLSLSPAQERQMFHDLNNLTLKIKPSFVLECDTSNPVNSFVNKVLVESNDVLPWDIRTEILNNRDWNNDSGEFKKADIVDICSLLFINKTSMKAAVDYSLIQERSDTVIKFFEQITKIPGLGEPGAKNKSIAAQPVVLKILARLFYTFNFNAKSKNKNETNANLFLQGLTTIDFSHENPAWSYFRLSDEEIVNNELEGLSSYLPKDLAETFDITQVTKDLKIKVGIPKVSNCAIVISDIIRFLMKLPRRESIEKQLN